MNFKKKWILHSFLIQSAVVGISIALFGPYAVGSTSDLLLEMFSFSILLFVTPAISIALPQALLLPFTKRQKIGWLFSTSIGLWGGAAVTMLLSIGISVGFSFLAFEYDFSFSFGSDKYIEILIIFLIALSSILSLACTGYILGTVQQKRLSQIGYAKFLRKNSWRTNIIKAILGSGVIFTGVMVLSNYSFIYSSTKYAGLIAASIGIAIYFSLLIPLTLFTATPATQLHAALNTPPPTANQ